MAAQSIRHGVGGLGYEIVKKTIYRFFSPASNNPCQKSFEKPLHRVRSIKLILKTEKNQA
jgi:hypothetical protein